MLMKEENRHMLIGGKVGVKHWQGRVKQPRVRKLKRKKVKITLTLFHRHTFLSAELNLGNQLF